MRSGLGPFLCFLAISTVAYGQYALEDDTRCGNYGEWWIYHKSSPSNEENCYQFLLNQPPASWENARNECKDDFKADFLNVNNGKDEIKFLAGKLDNWANTTYSQSNVLSEVWTGIQRTISNGNVVWTWNGNTLKETDLLLSDEAKKDESKTTKCLVLKSQNRMFEHKLYLKNCDEQLKNYICKKKAHAPRPRTQSSDEDD